jgi:hypothetical protein
LVRALWLRKLSWVRYRLETVTEPDSFLEQESAIAAESGV